MALGRKPKPAVIRQLDGNPGHRPIPEGNAEPDIPDDAPPPTYLSATAKAEWRRIVGDLLSSGLYTVIDRPALELYCETYAQWRRANWHLAREGTVKMTDGGWVQSPWVLIAARAGVEVRKLLTEFGASPSSRTRATTSRAVPAADEDELEALRRR